MSGLWDGDVERRSWHHGPWSAELRDDEVADISYDGRRVLRSIRAVVRDRDWNTASLVVDRIDELDSTLTLHVRSRGLGSSFAGVVHLEARATELMVACDLESAQPFDTNRTGLVVLHPPRLAGAALAVTHPDGSTEQTAFPAAISPHQPVFDITGLSWQDDGLDVDVRFEGDVFEMEDQRNWTDASFKTYSRPLALPFPYAVAAGERVTQTLRIGVRPASAPTVPAPADEIVLRRGGVFPAIGVAASTAPDPAPVFDPVGDVVLVELDLATRTWPAALARAAASGLPLDVRFVLSDADPEAIEAGARALAGRRLARVTAFWPTGPARHVSDVAAITALRAALARVGADAPVVGGVRSHFTELNREGHRLPDDLDGIVLSSTPLFHSLGREQLVESVAMQRLVAVQADGHAAGAPVHVGPVGLRPHFNDVATTPPPMPAHDDLRDGYGPALLDAVDDRQDADELAAWTIASAAAFSVPGVATVSFFEEWGPRGIRSADGADRPVAAAVRALAALAGSTLLHGASPDGLVWALGGETDERRTLLVANLGAQPRTVTIEVDDARSTASVPAGGWTRLTTPPDA